MDKKKILAVDDEEDILVILRYNLQKAGFEVQTALSAEEALSRDDLRSFDLILLDVMMQGISGFEMLRELRSRSETSRIPIIFLTARDAEEDKLEGFDAGADDYISKPFSIKELISRVNAVLRRTSPRVAADGLGIDEEQKCAFVDGKKVLLSPTEFAILRLLHSSPGRVFDREDILSKAWPDDVVVTDRSVDTTIARLRKKLGPYAGKIVSRHGFGYLWEDESA